LRAFDYIRPATIEEALSALEAHGPEARVLAGGTDLLVRLRKGHLLPRVVIDLKRVGGLHSGVVESEAGLRVGALATMTDIVEDERIRRHFPALVEAARVVGSVQIRNRATLAGNICNASPAADTAPALLVYGAVINLVGLAGRRRAPLAGFFTGPGRTGLNRGELLESIEVRWPGRRIGAAFGRVTRRRGVDLATINLCCLVTDEGAVRFAYGAVGPRPFLVCDESRELFAVKDDPRAVDLVLHRLIAHAAPISDLRGSREYRLAMLLAISRRALQTALERLSAAGGPA
jgi:CO/xanthine dehydrogenase FAD-binding subunit